MAMGLIDETLRGSRAYASLFLGAPMFFKRSLAHAKTRNEAQALLEQRAQRLLEQWGLRVEVTGEPPAPGRGCVLTYNETSFADSWAFHAVMWRNIERGSGADIFGVLPYAKAGFEQLGISLVPRGDRAGTDRVLAKMVAAVKAGERVAWGAEGRFSGKDAVARFKVGASLIAIRAGAPLVPVVFRGGHAALHHGSLRARPGRIRVHFAAPISTDGLAEQDARSLADRAQATVTEIYDGLS